MSDKMKVLESPEALRGLLEEIRAEDI